MTFTGSRIRNVTRMGDHSRGTGALRSSLLPGWGQWRQGRRPLALALFGAVMIPLVALGGMVLSDPHAAIAWLIQPDLLLGLLLLNVFLLGIRSWAVWDAWEAELPHPGTKVLLAILVFTLLPHAGIGWVQVRTIQALETVFAAPPVTPPESTVFVTTVTTEATTSPTPMVTTTTTTSTIPVTEPPLPPWGEHLTILFLGGDGGVGRTGVRTDAMLIMNASTTTADLALFSLPRNLRLFPFAEVPGFTDILNAVYQQGRAQPELFPGTDPGATAITSVAEQITGLDIDYYAMLDFYAFVSIVDALDGVTVNVPHLISFPEYRLENGEYIRISIEPGVRELTGDEALAFVRSREVGSDYGRMERQRCLVSALLAQVDMTSLILGLPRLISTFEDRVTTDIPLDTLPEMLQLMSRVDIEEATVTTFGPPVWHRGWVEGGWPIPDVAKIQDATRRLLAGDASALGDAEVVSVGSVCGIPRG